MYYLLQSQKLSGPKWIFLIGLIAALLGDIFLLFEEEQYFLFGLSSFLIMQILYTATFIKNSFVPSILKYICSIILLSLFGYYMIILWPKLEGMAIPVFIYSLVIVLMTISAMMRNQRLSGYGWVVIGAILFIISDGFIAWIKFISPLAGGGLMIMSTYLIAQYLIVIGFLKGEKNNCAVESC